MRTHRALRLGGEESRTAFLGAARLEEGAPSLAGGPAVGSGLGLQVEGMPAGGASRPEPDTGPAKDQGSRQRG